MHALPGPKVKSNCEQFQCVVRAVPAMKEDQRESAVRDLADILDVNPARRRSAVRGGVEEGRPDRLVMNRSRGAQRLLQGLVTPTEPGYARRKEHPREYQGGIRAEAAIRGGSPPIQRARLLFPGSSADNGGGRRLPRQTRKLRGGERRAPQERDEAQDPSDLQMGLRPRPPTENP